jgi:pimeloyl-ACP methyl ester carboxylesterase
MWELSDSEKVDLRVVRSASVGETKKGVIIVHAGGPGIEHENVLVDIRQLLGSQFDSWDVVALNTRGTANSHPFICDLDITEAVDRRLRCDSSSAFDSSWSTLESVEDLEYLRSELGIENVKYLGWSYGGTLGAAWFAKYSDSLSKVVLDAPGSPWQPWYEQMQARFDAMNSLAPEIIGEQSLVDSMQSVALEMAMYDPSLWSEFRLGLSGDESKIEDLVARRLGLRSTGDDGGIVAQIAVRCSDVSVDEMKEFDSLQQGPFNGIGLAVEKACADFELNTDQKIPPLPKTGSERVLVIGSEGDIASPYTVVQKVASMFGAKLFTVSGSRHTSVGSDSGATREAIDFLAG